MESNVDNTPKVDTSLIHNHEARFQKLAENTHGVLSAVEDPNVKESIPFVINYRPDEPSPEDTVRIYRGVNYVPGYEVTQLPSILRATNKFDQELIDLTIELADHPSEEIYNQIIAKNEQLGNTNSKINEAKEYISDQMEENGHDYKDAFDSMHRWENIASPYVSATSNIDKSFGYAMLGIPGMVIAADIPKSLVTHEFSKGFDSEVSVKGPILEKYIKSILLVNKRHSVDDQPFFESVKKLIK
jgi:hypothetical protein